MTESERRFLIELLDTGDYGATLEGRAKGTRLWRDYYGVVSQGRDGYVVEDRKGRRLFTGVSVEEAFLTWKRAEESEVPVKAGN